jgi:phage terminase large subunit GpA-like protein
MSPSLTDYQNDIAILESIIDDMPTDPPPRHVSEYIQARRIMPTNTPFPGPVDLSRTQYAVEIMDCMSPHDPTQFVDVMSASQLVKSFILECICGYYMGACPAPILFMSGTEDLLSKWWDKRLEPLIDSLGIRDKMISPVENEKSRRTGDTSKRKLFHGGFLERGSAQAASSQRADSVRILLLDELDAAPPLLNTGEGFWDENAEARTKGWGNRRKVGAFSTATEFQSSTIYRRFLLGDQCEYLVPCPHCNKFQFLERGTERGSHGLRVELKNGAVDFVYYLCDHCHDAIFENSKPWMIKSGRWEPKTKPERLRRSFHLNSLLAPYGGFSWLDYWTSYQKAQRSPDGMRVFTNHQDGLPYVASGSRPKAEIVLENRGKYREGTVPPGVLYLTAFVDVQRGSKNDPENPPRLEMEVLGIGAGYRSWSIIYRRFDGMVDDPYAGSWEDLFQYIITTEFTYSRREDSFRFPVRLALIDSGDGEMSDIVYRFCNRLQNTFPSKGFKEIHQRKKEKPDELTDSSFKRYRLSKLNEEISLYEISTVYYKNQVYNNLKIRRQESGEQKPGFCDFPIDYGQHYFDMLTAEEKMADGSFDSKSRRNEALDCRVGCLCAADIWLDSEVLNYRTWAKQNKASSHDILKITHRTVIDEMTRQTAIKRVDIKK